MRYVKRIGNILLGFFLFLFALILILFPEDSTSLIAAILNIALYVYGVKLLWYYLRMARHMVGGKTILYRSVIIIDVALFLTSAIAIDNYIVLIYLLFLFAFKGFIDILRAFEAKANGATNWKFKLATGIVGVLFAISLLIIGIILGDSDYLSIGFGISLLYSAVVRIITAFKKTAIVYIQ